MERNKKMTIKMDMKLDMHRNMDSMGGLGSKIEDRRSKMDSGVFFDLEGFDLRSPILLLQIEEILGIHLRIHVRSPTSRRGRRPAGVRPIN